MPSILIALRALAIPFICVSCHTLIERVFCYLYHFRKVNIVQGSAIQKLYTSRDFGKLTIIDLDRPPDACHTFHLCKLFS